MTDDPAIPQQGPILRLLSTPEVTGHVPAHASETYAKAREFDTAFAALESALRELEQAADDLRMEGPDNAIEERVYAAQEKADAALALAEAVRNG